MRIPQYLSRYDSKNFWKLNRTLLCALSGWGKTITKISELHTAPFQNDPSCESSLQNTGSICPRSDARLATRPHQQQKRGTTPLPGAGGPGAREPARRGRDADRQSARGQHGASAPTLLHVRANVAAPARTRSVASPAPAGVVVERHHPLHDIATGSRAGLRCAASASEPARSVYFYREVRVGPVHVQGQRTTRTTSTALFGRVHDFHLVCHLPQVTDSSRPSFPGCAVMRLWTRPPPHSTAQPARRLLAWLSRLARGMPVALANGQFDRIGQRTAGFLLSSRCARRIVGCLDLPNGSGCVFPDFPCSRGDAAAPARRGPPCSAHSAVKAGTS